MGLNPLSKYAISGVAVATSPATSGLTLTVLSGDGAKFSAGKRLVLAPVGSNPTESNTEEVLVTDVTGDVLTIVRNLDGGSAVSVSAFTANTVAAAAAGYVIYDVDTPADRVDLWVLTKSISPKVVEAVGRSTAQVAAKASVVTHTPTVDASFEVSANVLVTTSTTHDFTVTCAYTDESNVARTLTLAVCQLDGKTHVTNITNTTGAGPYHGSPARIRAKAGTAITVATVGTFTTVAYNVEASIRRVG